jgi:hypothetical protein
MHETSGSKPFRVRLLRPITEHSRKMINNMFLLDIRAIDAAQIHEEW